MVAHGWVGLGFQTMLSGRISAVGSDLSCFRKTEGDEFKMSGFKEFHIPIEREAKVLAKVNCEHDDYVSNLFSKSVSCRRKESCTSVSNEQSSDRNMQVSTIRFLEPMEL